MTPLACANAHSAAVAPVRDNNQPSAACQPAGAVGVGKVTTAPVGIPETPASAAATAAST